MTTTNNQRKIFITIIAILLIANIALIGFILKTSGSRESEKRPDKKEQAANFLRTDIGFGPQQLQQFDSLNKWHREQISSLYDSARNSKTAQLQALARTNFSDTAIEVAINKSCAVQKAVERQMLLYIKNIRQLCTPAQLPAFDSLYVKIFNKRSGKRNANQRP